MNPAEIFSEVGKKIFKKTLKKMFENEVHCFLTTQCFQLLNCIESHRIALNRTESFFINMHLFLYRANVSRYESDRLFHERFTPLIHIYSYNSMLALKCLLYRVLLLMLWYLYTFSASHNLTNKLLPARLPNTCTSAKPSVLFPPGMTTLTYCPSIPRQL